MFIDPHVHTKEISLCSQMTLAEMVDLKRSLGYDGVVLTNHCQPWYYEKPAYKSFIERFIATYREGKKYADSGGFKFFLGIEVTLTDPEYADYLIYGATEKFLTEAKEFCAMSQKELYTYCKDNGKILIQAHPFREPIRPQDPKYLDGVEINFHPKHDDEREKVISFADENGLIVTCGSDHHISSQTKKCGMIIPDDVGDAEDFAEYLKGGHTEIRIDDTIIKHRIVNPKMVKNV